MAGRYVVIEGTEGLGKSTQTHLLAEALKQRGFKVLVTKEPGSPHAPLTVTMRALMLDKQFDDQMTPVARELISQAIRAIHIEKVVKPALQEYDYVIQDRGILSGFAYATALGHSPEWIESLSYSTVRQDGSYQTPYDLYTDVLVFKGDVSAGLDRAKSSKQEYAAGDVIENKGSSYLTKVAHNMMQFSRRFDGVKYIDVTGKDILAVHEEILSVLNTPRTKDENQE